MNTLSNWLQNFPLSNQWLYSILCLPILLAIRHLLLRWHFQRHPNLGIEEKRRIVVFARNITLITAVFGLFAIWFAQIQTFALSMVALAAATVLATKELIMCLCGSLLRTLTQQYAVGDQIEIAHIRGRVVDINLFNTLVMQIGPHPLIGQLSGRTVSFPNSLLLSHPVQRDNTLGRFVVHTFGIPVPIHLDADLLVGQLMIVLQNECAPYATEAHAYLESVQERHLFITPAATPRISRVPDNDKTYQLIVRFAAPANKRLDIQQAVLDAFIRLQHTLLNPKAT